MNNSPFNIKFAQCPGCGARLEFKIGTSRVVVCDYCHFAVARGDRGLENIGKMADLAPTGARLALGLEGLFENVEFRIVGRLQYKWEQGVWDEWHISLKDGRWGWLAEAQGRYYVTFRIQPRQVPPFSALKPGKVFSLSGLGPYAVSDLKQAQYAAAIGELPELFKLGGLAIRSADLSGRSKSFVTIDYGADDKENPVIFSGRELELSELGLRFDSVAQVKTEKIAATKLVCPKCNGPLELRAPDSTMRVTCQHCNALLDTTSGKLKYLAALEPVKLALKLGSKAKFFGVEYILIGWLERKGLTVEQDIFYWEEYLLYNESNGSFRFLVCSDGHWSFVEPVSPGEVSETLGVTALYKGKTFKKFSAVTATVTKVLGEFYWQVCQGETVAAIDYIFPPEALSRESNNEEINWSHAVYIAPGEISSAFGMKGSITTPKGVGMMQPNPYAIGLSATKRWAVRALGIAFLLYLIFVFKGEKTVFEDNFVPQIPSAAASPEGEQASESEPQKNPSGEYHAPTSSEPWVGVVRFSNPFKIDSRGRLMIELSSDVKNSWIFMGGALINQSTNQFTEFGLENSYYSGVDDGESWSEGSRKAETYISSIGKGEYVLRQEIGWENRANPPNIQLRITCGGARFLHLLLAAMVILAGPLLAYLGYTAFERRRLE